jgi:hypothetical protein
MTELLLTHGADISIEDNGGRNALHHLLGLQLGRSRFLKE